MGYSLRASASIALSALAFAFASPAGASVQDDVRAAAVNALQASRSVSRADVHVSYVSVAGRWAFVSWNIVGAGRGDTVLLSAGDLWHVFAQGSDQLTLRNLTRFGVPPALGAALLGGVCPIPAASIAAGYAVTSVAVRRFDRNGKRIDKAIVCRSGQGTRR